MIGLFRSIAHSYQIMLLQLKGAMSIVTELIRKERHKANIDFWQYLCCFCQNE